MSLTPNEAYAAKQPFVDKETLEHIVEQFPTPFHLYLSLIHISEPTRP